MLWYKSFFSSAAALRPTLSKAYWPMAAASSQAAMSSSHFAASFITPAKLPVWANSSIPPMNRPTSSDFI